MITFAFFKRPHSPSVVLKGAPLLTGPGLPTSQVPGAPFSIVLDLTLPCLDQCHYFFIGGNKEGWKCSLSSE